MGSLFSWLTGNTRKKQSNKETRQPDTQLARDDGARHVRSEEARNSDARESEHRVEEPLNSPDLPSEEPFDHRATSAEVEEEGQSDYQVAHRERQEDAKTALFVQIKNLVEVASHGRAVVERGSSNPDVLDLRVNGEEAVGEKSSHSLRFVLCEDGTVLKGHSAKPLNIEQTARELMQIAAWHMAKLD